MPSHCRVGWVATAGLKRVTRHPVTRSQWLAESGGVLSFGCAVKRDSERAMRAGCVRLPRLAPALKLKGTAW